MEFIDIDSGYDLEDAVENYRANRIQSIIDDAYDMHDLDGYINTDY